MKNLFYLLFVGSFLASGVTFADDETPLAEEMSEASGFLKLLRRAREIILSVSSWCEMRRRPS